MLIQSARLAGLQLPFLAASIFFSFGDFAMGSDANSGGQPAAEVSMNEQIAELTKLDSATSHLTVEDLDKFQAGRPKREVLEDIQWRGLSSRAAICDGTSITTIGYTLYADGIGPGALVVESFTALFVDERFDRFVRRVADTERFYKGKSRYSRARRRKGGGECEWIMRVMKSETRTIDQLEEEAKTAKPREESIDWGMTIAVYPMVVIGEALDRAKAPPLDEVYEMLRENVALQDQFNAARLSLGMTESEVQTMLNASPLESGEVEAGHYEIYGSNKTFEPGYWHGLWPFTNILVVYREGRTVAISSISSGPDWREKLSETYTDLPVPPATDSSDER